MNSEALDALSTLPLTNTDAGITIRRLSLAGLAHAHLDQSTLTEQELVQAQSLCSAVDRKECSDLLRARGGVAFKKGDYIEADRLYSESLLSARKFGQRWDESVALMNLGANNLNLERFDEAIDRLRDSNSIAEELQAEDVLVNNLGNLGWAYYKLGDAAHGLQLLSEGESRAVKLGDTDVAIASLTDLGHVYQDTSNLAQAAQSHLKALELARSIDSKDEVVTALEDLAHLYVAAGRPDEASVYVDQVAPLAQANGNRVDALVITLARGKVALARHHNQEAETNFQTVEHDPGSQPSMRLAAEHELARSFEMQGEIDNSDRMYRTALNTFESARGQIQRESSKLPFLTNARSIYDDYIQFLIKQGKTNEALITADQSRARTLAQDPGVDVSSQAIHAFALSPQAVARKTGATLLFYWLGAKQSYLWVITPDKTTLFPLQAESEITPLIELYRKTLLGGADPVQSASVAGRTLFKLLVAPASNLIPANSTVMIFADGALSQLNFETLIAPGQSQNSQDHYWIEDVTLTSAPSLAMLAAAKAERHANGKMLLLGDAVSASEDYPELPFAAVEMQQIQKHFDARGEVVFARQKATPAAYLGSDPKQFSYIHFVSHGVASLTDPLDSAIILSRGTAAEDGFKLYAREVMQHPIDAQLVTVSACYGSGTRAFVGEGLVGLSWAFLRAGAHNAIGALWEASDESTPRLMDAMYQGIESGETPAVALRNAKLTLLHSQGNFRKPFYWAPFQLYTRL